TTKKSLTKSLDNLHFEVARFSAALNQATILEAERDGGDSTVEGYSSEIFFFLPRPIPGFGLEVNAMVDGSNAELTDDAASSKSGGVFVHGNSHVLNDVAGVTMVGSERVSSSLTDVVVVLSAGEKGDGSLPSFATDEEATTNLSRV
nr:hypothetical protein [Tanacetum cinerariifolium]